MRRAPSLITALATAGLLLWPVHAGAQVFSRITTGAIATDTGPAQYSGASWVDYDGDGDLDLYVNNRYLYRNDGGGTFAKVTTQIGATQIIATGNGNSWADYDNDGDLDVFVSGITSILYANQGNGTFVEVLSGDIGQTTANRGWACAWADYDNDGDVDLLITHPCGFVGGCLTNRFLVNNGPPGYTFTRQDTGVVVSGFAPYTVGTWSDYDLDGDQDLFIGTGPASATPGLDNLYRNRLTETGAAFFAKITTAPIATDLRDGQVWNWIDYDNDGDLDGYVTNWGGNGSVQVNNLYRNDGGVYVKPAAGPIGTDVRVSLASLWGDYDNDGDLDCLVTNDNGQADSYYRNLGNGTFQSVSLPPTQEGLSHRGGTVGDYDGDGDLDLFLVGPSTSRRFYRNDTANGNAWIVIDCEGTTSNRSGIGARVEVDAVIGGLPRHQMREVSAQNSFNGHNMLPVHFGLGDAAIVDTVRIHWPSGIVDTYTGVETSRGYTAVEGQAIGVVGVEPERGRDAALVIHGVVPNPSLDRAVLSFSLAREGRVRIDVFDLAGRRVATPLDALRGPGRQDVDLDAVRLDAGVYYYRVRFEGRVRSGRFARLH